MTTRKAELVDSLGAQEPGVMQVGILVRDLDAALVTHSALWRLGPWQCYTYGPQTVPRLTYRGREGTYSMELALAGSGPQVELIQPLEGPSIYDEWLERHGPGLHHVAYRVERLEAAIAAMDRMGYRVIQSGSGYGLDGDGGYAYFDTEDELGVIVEAVELPRRRQPPDRLWPP